METKYTEAQKKADKNWRDKNKEHATYLRNRSSAKSFIRNKATLEDITELEQLIEARKNDFKNL
ncbi:MAG: hypothetical protein PHX70_14130 [Clostridium sp.]|nr:hypothetical protein [Clostridium sp.]